jgi:biopolymer transport protein TolQ
MKNQGIIELLIDAGYYATGIMLILVIMSVLMWGVIGIKWFFYSKLQKNNRAFYAEFKKVKSIQELPALAEKFPLSGLSAITKTVLLESAQLSDFVSYDNMHHRAALIEEAIQRSIEEEHLEEERLLSVLAIISSLAPFLGLLGTVWGIMDSFFDIGSKGSAELSVVAPGIAAALVTTVAGLVVAIPASGFHNYYTSVNNKNEVYYYGFGSELLGIFKRTDLSSIEKKA